jgi:hypothetical protein
MFKKVFTTLAFCMLITSSILAQNWDASEPASYHSSVVKVTGDGYSGSGTVIKFIKESNKHEGYYVGWVLTASHVIRSKETLFTLHFKNGKVTENGTVVVKKNDVADSFNDLAIIRALIPKDIVPMEISTEDVPMGAEVELCGYATGELRHWTAKYAGECMDHDGHVVFTWGIQGDSGGPIIHKGKIVGVICFGTGVGNYEETHRAIVCPVYGSNVERISSFINNN